MISREELNGKSIEEVGRALEADIANYSAHVSALGLSELDDEEAKLVTALEEYDAYLNETKYVLPKHVMFEEETYTKETVANFIVGFIDKQEVEWSYSVGLRELVQLWNRFSREKTDSYINYKAYDSTLRILGGLKYKGFVEWTNIAVVVEYTKGPHETYNIDTSYFIYLSKLHNTILDKRQELQKEGEMIMEAEEV